jgi:hypothetical protein
VTSSKQRSRLHYRVAGKQNWLCHYCGQRMLKEQDQPLSVTLERLVPGVQGGRFEYGNVVAVCRGCNNDPRDGIRLAKPPDTPSTHSAGDGRSHSLLGPWPPDASATLADVWPVAQKER